MSMPSLSLIHALLKKVNKKELKFITKPWITQGLQNSIKKKIYILKICKMQKPKALKNFITIITRPA